MALCSPLAVPSEKQTNHQLALTSMVLTVLQLHQYAALTHHSSSTHSSCFPPQFWAPHKSLEMHLLLLSPFVSLCMLQKKIKTHHST